VTAEDLAQVRGERFFEVYNGHPQVHNGGDELHASTERMWDLILTQRLAELGGEPLYGIATDDSHHYHSQGPERSTSGRGWVMVQATRLTPEAIVASMEAGEFYASTGVRLKTVRREGSRLSLEIESEPGVTYVTHFVGTRKGYNRRSEPARGADGKELPVSRRYTSGIGMVLAETRGATAIYILRGDELYVRAKVTSTKRQENPNPEGGMQSAWVQPLIPGTSQ
jgi:hypothetical protein